MAKTLQRRTYQAQAARLLGSDFRHDLLRLASALKLRFGGRPPSGSVASRHTKTPTLSEMKRSISDSQRQFNRHFFSYVAGQLNPDNVRFRGAGRLAFTVRSAGFRLAGVGIWGDPGPTHYRDDLEAVRRGDQYLWERESFLMCEDEVPFDYEKSQFIRVRFVG